MIRSVFIYVFSIDTAVNQVVGNSSEVLLRAPIISHNYYVIKILISET